MIEAKMTNDEKKGVLTEMEINGIGDDILAEAVTLIGALFKSIRDMSEDMYGAMLFILARHPEILQGEMGKSEKGKYEEEMSKLMSKAIIREGELN